MACDALRVHINTGYRLSEDPVVVAEIERLEGLALARHGKTVNEVLDEVTTIAFSRMRDYFSKETGQILPVHEMGDGDRAIKRVRHKVVDRADGSRENHYEYEMWDKLKALEVLAEFHKIIKRGVDDVDPGERVILVLPDNSGPEIEDQSREIEADYTDKEVSDADIQS
jgi:hypothetical protein